MYNLQVAFFPSERFYFFDKKAKKPAWSLDSSWIKSDVDPVAENPPSSPTSKAAALPPIIEVR